jgi:hypothetical protein
LVFDIKLGVPPIVFFIVSRKKLVEIFVAILSFVNLISLLSEKYLISNIEPVKTRWPILCAEVIKTLTSLLSNNAKNKDNFRINIGYDQLKNVILFSNDNHPSRIVLDLLFDMVSGYPIITSYL